MICGQRLRRCISKSPLGKYNKCPIYHSGDLENPSSNPLSFWVQIGHTAPQNFCLALSRTTHRLRICGAWARLLLSSSHHFVLRVRTRTTKLTIVIPQTTTSTHSSFPRPLPSVLETQLPDGDEPAYSTPIKAK